MKFVQRKATTSKGKHTMANFTQLKEAFLDDVVEAVTMEDVPAKLILHWDQTGITLVPARREASGDGGCERQETNNSSLFRHSSR